MKRWHTQSHNPSKAPSFSCLQKSVRALISEKNPFKTSYWCFVVFRKHARPNVLWNWRVDRFESQVRSRNTARSKFVDDARSTRGIGLRRLGEEVGLSFTASRGMIVWKERRKNFIGDETDRCWESRDPYYRRYTKMFFWDSSANAKLASESKSNVREIWPCHNRIPPGQEGWNLALKEL